LPPVAVKVVETLPPKAISLKLPELVIESAGSTVRLNDAATVTPLPSASFTWKLKLPAVAGVPLSTDAEKVSPDGAFTDENT
jgi:hypothetical protein